MNNQWFQIKTKLLNNIVWILLLLAVIVIGGLDSSFFTPTIMGNVLSQAAVLGILSFAQSFAIMLGLIDLSLLGVMSFSATMGLILIEKGAPVLLAVPVIFLTGALLGAMNGFLIAKLKAVALVETLAVKLTLLGAFLVITEGRAITSMPASYKWFGQGAVLGIPTLPIALAIVFVAVYILWNKTPYGRSLYAVGGNENAAHTSGIKVDHIKIIAFTISGFLAGVAGFFLSAYMGAVTSTFRTSYDMNNIAASVIGGVACSGGQGNVLGVLGGVLLLTVIQVGLQILGVSSYYVQMINGLIIFVAVLLDALRLKTQHA